MQKCETCVFWIGSQCRRHSPAPSEIERGHYVNGVPYSRPAWPTTYSDDGCGDHQPKAADA